MKPMSLQNLLRVPVTDKMVLTFSNVKPVVMAICGIEVTVKFHLLLHPTDETVATYHEVEDIACFTHLRNIVTGNVDEYTLSGTRLLCMGDGRAYHGPDMLSYEYPDTTLTITYETPAEIEVEFTIPALKPAAVMTMKVVEPPEPTNRIQLHNGKWLVKSQAGLRGLIKQYVAGTGRSWKSYDVLNCERIQYPCVLTLHDTNRLSDIYVSWRSLRAEIELMSKTLDVLKAN